MKEKNEKTRDLVVVNLNPANPAELMFGWCEVMRVTFALTWLCGAIAANPEVGHPILSALFIAIIMGFTWISGGLAIAIVEGVSESIARTSPVYARAQLRSQSLFACGIRAALKRCLCLPVGSLGGISVFVTLFCSFTIVLGDILSLFYRGAWCLALAVGIVFSVLSFVVVSIYLLRDYVRERRLARQVF